MARVLIVLFVFVVAGALAQIQHGVDGNYLFTMTNQAYPKSGKPGVLVHKPPTFVGAGGLYNLVIFFHGHSNCVQNCVLEGTVGTAKGAAANGPMSAGCGSGPRNSYSLIKSFDAAKLDALLVVPELAYDKASSDPGTFKNKGGFKAFMVELLGSSALGSVIAPKTLADIGKVSIQGHSGAYWAIASILKNAELAVDQVVLFDSMYDMRPAFENWAIAKLAGSCKFQWVDIYGWGDVFQGKTRGTLTLSQTMATNLKKTNQVKANPSLMLDVRTPTRTLATNGLSYTLYFQYTLLTHNNIPFTFFGDTTAAFGNLPLCAREGGTAQIEDTDNDSLSSSSAVEEVLGESPFA